MYAESQNSDKKLKKVFILNENKSDHLQVFAKSGEFLGNEQTNSSFGLKLFNGEIYNNSEKDLNSLVISFKSYLIELFETKKAAASTKRQVQQQHNKKA